MGGVPVEGVIPIYKPPGRSSAQYVYRLRPILGERRIGHAGTLDPFADGVLVACVGRATRLVERLMNLPKTYHAVITLGVTSATLDPESPLEAVAGAADPGRAAVECALAGLVGEIEQTPPLYSAVKIGGRPAYRLARRAARLGEHAEALPKPAARRVRVEDIRLLAYAWPTAEVVIRCGRGTYIRSIARDLGAATGCGGVCTQLTRTAVGPFELNATVRLENSTPEQVRDSLRPISSVLALLGPADGH